MHQARGKLSGILYLHQITDDRMKGSALKNLAMFQKLIGDRCLKNCVLVTTKWGRIDPELGRRREQELTEKFWAPMVACGSTMQRFDGSCANAAEIVGMLAHRSGIVPRLTDEICYQGKKLKNTAAGKVVEVDMNEVCIARPCPQR